MTKVRVVPVKTIERLVAFCVGDARVSNATRVVERVGVSGRTITFPGPDRTIRGCDRNPTARSIQGIWCGGAGWNLRDGHVSDPRLDLCYDRRNRPVVGFAWINPLPRARWIAVAQPGYREVYAVAGNLPVRVSTISDLRRGGRVVFRTAQYDGHGVLLVRRKVVAAIAS